MQKITKLTKEQEARFPEFVDKWTKIGLSTEPANRPEAERGIVEAYAAAGLGAPKVVWCGSPLGNGLAREAVNKMDSVRASVWDSVRASVGDSVRASVRASVGDSVGDSVWDSVWDSVGDSVGDSVRASVLASVGDSVGDSVWDSVWASVGASVGDSGYGQHDANWVGFYSYFRDVAYLKSETEKLCGLARITRNAGWYLPHKGICWVSERHNILNRNEKGRLHKDGGPAVAYPDGWEIYALNGIRVKKCQAMTPAERFDPKDVLQEQNADVRRELIRKIGVERMLSTLPHKNLSKRGNYEVLSVELSPEVKDARYLRMLNPSIGVWHLEGVSPECSTVEQALNWRNQNMFTDAEVLT